MFDSPPVLFYGKEQEIALLGSLLITAALRSALRRGALPSALVVLATGSFLILCSS